MDECTAPGVRLRFTCSLVIPLDIAWILELKLSVTWSICQLNKINGQKYFDNLWIVYVPDVIRIHLIDRVVFFLFVCQKQTVDCGLQSGQSEWRQMLLLALGNCDWHSHLHISREHGSLALGWKPLEGFFPTFESHPLIEIQIISMWQTWLFCEFSHQYFSFTFIRLTVHSGIYKSEITNNWVSEYFCYTVFGHCCKDRLNMIWRLYRIHLYF